MKTSKIIGLTPGSEAGVGPELMLKALKDKRFLSMKFFWCGDEASLMLAAQRSSIKIHLERPGEAQLIDGPSFDFLIDKPPSSFDYRQRQAWFLAEAVKRGEQGLIDALITGPIEKEALRFLSPRAVGQTEYIAAHWGLLGHKPFMAFMGGPFLLSLLTTHVPLAEVPKRLSKELIFDHVRELAFALTELLNKRKEELSIDILGLNPHAGENGLLGMEEQEIIIPAIKALESEHIGLRGPWPADGYFAYFYEKPLQERPDAVVAIYHDQGLAPYKLMSEGAAVNITLGLKIPRLSPAHGTANHLAGKNIASPASTINAFLLALKIIGKG